MCRTERGRMCWLLDVGKTDATSRKTVVLRCDVRCVRVLLRRSPPRWMDGWMHGRIRCLRNRLPCAVGDGRCRQLPASRKSLGLASHKCTNLCTTCGPRTAGAANSRRSRFAALRKPQCRESSVVVLFRETLGLPLARGTLDWDLLVSDLSGKLMYTKHNMCNS